MSYQTRAVLAACYLGPNKSGSLSGRRRMLTHTVEVDDATGHFKLLCSRVSELSLADEYADDPNKLPTCPECLRRDPRAK